jgi:Mobilization protein NikA
MVRRTGTEKRHRSMTFTLRLSPQEAEAIRARAADHGQTAAALVRSALLHIRLPHSRIDRKQVAHVLAELGKIGSNVNQIAYHLNAGRPPERVYNALELALRDLGELRLACLQAIGMEPRRGDKGEG